MSPCKVKPKEKKFMHDKGLSLCVPRLKSRAKEARLIMEVDNLKSGPILAVLIYFLSLRKQQQQSIRFSSVSPRSSPLGTFRANIFSTSFLFVSPLNVI